MSPSAALLAPLRTVRRSRLEDRNQSEPPTNTPFASPREAQSSGAQCEGGWAEARGFTIAFDIVRLLPTRRECCRKSLPVKERVLPLARPRARVHLQEDPAADRVPLGRERGRLADDVEIPPALGQAALAPVRRAATVPVHQIHRLARTVGSVDRGQPATGPLLEGGVLAGRDGIPEIGDRRTAVHATSVQDRVGSTDRVLNLRVLAEPTGPAARCLRAGQLDQRVDPGPGDSGDHGAVVGPDPGLGWQRVRNPRPPLPLVVERDAGVDHRAPLRQEDIVDRPVETAGRTHSGHVPAALDDLRFRTREDSAPVDRGAIRAPARLVAVENLEASQHPGALLAAGAEGPATRDSVATIDGYGPSASHHGGAGDDGVPARVNLLHALVRQ